ncbi:hypothetical protein BGW42_000397 [Actinomortierella wolfii]|nr:hypothetical protein BGW42_000397 [Actinomortierella wolfii]
MAPNGSIREAESLHASDDEHRDPSSDEDEVKDPPKTYHEPSDDDDDDDDDNIFKSELDEAAVSSQKQTDYNRLLDAMTTAYLQSRKDDKFFQRDVIQDKERLSMARTVARSTDDEQSQPQRDRTAEVNDTHTQADPFFGFDSLDGYDSISPDVAPEDMSAHYPLRRHYRTLSNESQQDNSSRNTFRLVANVSSVAAGHYGMYLKTKEINGDTTAARFSVRVLVRYRDMRMVQPFYTRFFKSPKDECSEWCYLKAENLFEVYPHTGMAQVNIHITSDKTFDEVRGQLLIRSLRLVLVGSPDTLGPEPILSRSILADYSIPIHPPSDRYRPDDHRFGISPPGGNQEANNLGVISRLAVSKNGNFLAALVKYQDQFAVEVWCLNKLRNEYQPISQSRPVVTTHNCTNAGRLPLELDISATGEHIAVFQTPRIGDWNEDTVLPTSDIGVCLFRNIQATSHEHLVISVDERASLAEHHDPTLVVHSLVKQNAPDALKHAIGYAAFVDEFKSEEHTLPTRFVFCNGLYLDVYELHSNGFIHSNTIPLYHMNSALHRATACALMMRSIAINMFIWVEDNGRYCTAWDLSNGSAISRFEIAGLQFGGFANATSTQVACNQNIIAIVGHDNTITTVDASCGIVISRRLILDSVIEDIAFPSAQSQMLIVKIRGEGDNQQTTLILDPLRLDIQEQIQFMPPLSSLTALGLSGPKSWPEIGVVCWPDENQIHVYECKQPTVQIHGARAPIANDVVDRCPYELRFTIPARPSGATGGSSLTRQVEVWAKGERSTQVFSFVPEPWELHKAVDGRILPPGDRFVVYASWTIQLWSLPTADEPRCRLLFFWSIANNTNVKGELGNSDLETVLESHTRFNSAYIYEYSESDMQQRFRVTVVSSLKSVIQVQIPSSHNLYSDSQVTAKSCIEGIWLLALSHSMISIEHQSKHEVEKYSGDNRDHVSAIVEFVNGYINHSVLQDQSNERTVLTHLLEISNLSDLGAKFITALLESDHCSWIPSMTSSGPIALAVQRRNTMAVRAILNYCTRKAAESHPAYLIPVEHSFKGLVEVYPELLRDFFRRASYIPAQRADFNTKYVATSAYSWGLTKDKLLSWISRSKKKHAKSVGYKKQTFSFQLKKSRNTNHRKDTIPQRPAHLDPIRLQYDCMVYVAPFPSLITLGTGSQFHLLAGKGFFDSPALMAVLRYKTWQYGLFYWIYRYIWLAVFYGTFLATTSAQLQSSKAMDSLPGPISRYLGDYWIVIPVIGLFAGSYLLVEEILQLATFGNSRYLKSLYNYVEVTSILLTMICLGQTIHTFWMQGPDSYQQFGLTSFAIMAMYLHVIAETRIFKGVGTIVNTIVLVVQKIWSFLFVFLLIIIATTHSLFYLQQAYQTECNESGVCTRSSSSHPYNVFSSFATTLFFMVYL